MRGFPEGFARYRGSSASLSATVNKYLRANDLVETPEHTLYCLRHSFEDRMLAAGIDERIRRDLMGHSLRRERYGDGGSLEMLSEVLAPVALLTQERAGPRLGRAPPGLRRGLELDLRLEPLEDGRVDRILDHQQRDGLERRVKAVEIGQRGRAPIAPRGRLRASGWARVDSKHPS